MIDEHYPAAAEIDAWCADILRRAEHARAEARPVDAPQYNYQLGVRHTKGNQYIGFEAPGRTTFYGYWQPASKEGAPVLFHVPGYGAEMSAHPELVSAGFNVLHINPLGYCTPSGASGEPARLTVMPDTVKTEGRGGYVDWLTDAAIAVRWARSKPGLDGSRFGFFGSSQGGGTALLLGSIFAAEGVRAVAADVPYLTNYPLAAKKPREKWGAYAAALGAFSTAGGTPAEWRALGFIDTLSHAHRLTVPVLLTAGSRDGVTPADSVESLFDLLPATRSYTLLDGQDHAYTMPFLHLARAWFGLYV